MLLLPAAAGMAAPSTVPDDARITAEMVREEAKILAEQDQAKLQAKMTLAQIEADVAQLEAGKTAKEATVLQAETALQQAEAAVQAASTALAAARAETVAANEALVQAGLILQQATAIADAASAAEDEAANAANDREYAAAEARALAAARRAETAEASAEAAQAKAAAAEERLEAAEEAGETAREKADEAKTAADAIQTELKDIEAELLLAKAELTQAKAALTELQKEPDIAARHWTTAETGTKYYTWRDDEGHSGYQWYQPYTLHYVSRNMEYSLQTGYVLSESKSAADGRMATWTDTTLGMAYNQQHHQDMFIYRLDVNIPTGKAALNGYDAIMSDDLVEHSRFGEGLNVTPGIWVNHKIGKEDTWTVGTYYTFRGGYTYDASIDNGRIDPGNVWVKSLRWQHAGQKWQLVSELTHTSAATTQDGNTTYRQGDQLNMNLTYNRVLPKNQNLMLYYWYEKEQPYTSADPAIATGETMTRQYCGAMWSKNWTEKQTFRIGADMMKRDGRTYDPLTNLTSDKRTKYSVGVGYDFNFAADKKLSVDVRQFYMKDNEPSNNGYHGSNIFLRYSYVM